MDIQFLDLHDLGEDDKDVLTSVMNSNIEDVQLPWTTDGNGLDNNNSDNNCIAEQNIEQFSSNDTPHQVPVMYNNWQTQTYNVPHGNYMPYPTQVNRAYNYDMGNMNYDSQNTYDNNYDNNNRNTYSPINQIQSAYMNMYSYSQMPMAYYPGQQQFPPQMTNRQFYYNTSTHQSYLQHDTHTNNLVTSHPICVEHFHQSSPPVITNTLCHQSVPMFSQPIFCKQPLSYQQSQPMFYQQSQPISYQQSQPVSYQQSQPMSYQQSQPIFYHQSQPILYQEKTYVTQQNDIQTNESVQSQNISHNLNSQQVNSNNDTIPRNNTIKDTNNESLQNQNIFDNLDVQQANNDNTIALNNIYITENTIVTHDSTQEAFLVKDTNKNTTTEIVATTNNDLQNDVKVEQSVIQNTGEIKKEKKILNNVQTIITSNGPMSNVSSLVSESKITKSEPETVPKPKKSYASFFKKNEPLSTHKTTTGNSSNENNNNGNENGSLYEKTTSIRNKVKQNGMLNGVSKDEYTSRLAKFLSNYKMDKRPTSLIPRGLKNPSSYCYINSILQGLIACSPFYNLFKNMPIWENRNGPASLIDNMIRFVHEFTPMAISSSPKMDRGNNRGKAVVDIRSDTAFQPSYLHTMFRGTANFCRDGQQEDAEEFLSYLLNGIDNEMLEIMKFFENKKTEENIDNVKHEHNETKWKVVESKKKKASQSMETKRTPLSNIFRGQLRSRIWRAKQQPTDNIEPFFTLRLDVHKAKSIQDAFEVLVDKDQIEGITCSKTKKNIKAWKQTSLEELPVILILHLQWFVYNARHYNGYSKIIKNFEFPVNLKIDDKFLSSNSKRLSPGGKQYKLCAVTYHDGMEATKGHYITDAFHAEYNTWVRYNDSTVKCVSESTVLNPVPPSVPYLLYYRRYDAINH